jgi:hypothetical protein
VVLEISEDGKFVPTGFVGVESPVVGRINQPHSFKAEEFPIGRAGKFAVHNAAHSAGFADKIGPLRDGREAETNLVPTPRGKGKANRDARGVVCRSTRPELGPAGGGEPAAGERAAKGVRSPRERLETTRATVPLVPGAIWPRREGQSVPAYREWGENVGEEGDTEQEWVWAGAEAA